MATSKVGSFKSKVSAEGKTQLRESGLTYRNQFELASGQYGVRFAIRDNATGRIGSVWTIVEVP